jgi:hypothetical protein
MLIKLNAAQVAVYRDLLSRQARRGRITPVERLKASLAARDYTPPPPRKLSLVERDKATLQRAARRMA